MEKQLKEAVIVTYGRSAVGKFAKGTLRREHPIDFAAQVLRVVLTNLSPRELDQHKLWGLNVKGEQNVRNLDIDVGGDGNRVRLIAGEHDHFQLRVA